MDIREVNNMASSRHPWELVRYDVVNSILQGKIKPNCHILDLGCGDLFFAKKMLQNYPSISIDTVDTAFDDVDLMAMNTTARLSVYSNILDMDQTKPIDIILLLDVLEHIESESAFLSNLKTQVNISPNTLFCITVPAFQSLFCSHDTFLGHYRRYSKKTLIKTMREAGFEIRNSGYFFTSLLLPRFIQVKQEQKHHTTHIEGVGNWTGGRLKTALVLIILKLDFWICGRVLKFLNIPGLSTYVVCKQQ